MPHFFAALLCGLRNVLVLADPRHSMGKKHPLAYKEFITNPHTSSLNQIEL